MSQSEPPSLSNTPLSISSFPVTLNLNSNQNYTHYIDSVATTPSLSGSHAVSRTSRVTQTQTFPNLNSSNPSRRSFGAGRVNNPRRLSLTNLSSDFNLVTESLNLYTHTTSSSSSISELASNSLTTVP